jgi:hypothetical protein
MELNNLNIELPNYARPNDWWLDENLNYYVLNILQVLMILLKEKMKKMKI